MFWKFSGLIFLIFIRGFSPDHPEKFYPLGYFRSPVDGALQLSGTFGELRSDHFHSGIDIKPFNKKAGQAIYAAAEGYIERIKVEASGYGNVLYLRHPNGYSTVYAHLQSFMPEVAAYVEKAQYQNQRFNINIHPKKTDFPVKKGQIIGYLGNSGSSTGPHLHFEIRDSAKDIPLNPLLFGFNPEDTLPPQMLQLKVYALNDKMESSTSKTFELEKRGKDYFLKNDTIGFGAWRAGFALKTYDQMPGGAKWNGIYSLQLFKEDSLWYDFDFEKFGFSESRYVNAHLDYSEHFLKKSNFHRCFSLPGNRLSIYKKKKNGGVISLFKNRPTKIRLVSKDFSGNSTTLIFWIKRDNIPGSNSKIYNHILHFDQEHTISTDLLELNFPKNTFYEDCYFQLKSTDLNAPGHFSPLYHLHQPQTPVHTYFKISITPPKPLTENQKKKAFIAFVRSKNRIQNCGGSWMGEKLSAEVRRLGDYCIMIDSAAPTIVPRVFSKEMQKEEKMTFKISDNYSVTGKARGLRYRATVDGRWILMEYDAKNNLLSHRFNDRIAKGEHKLRLEVTDDRGNLAVFEDTFAR